MSYRSHRLADGTTVDSLDLSGADLSQDEFRWAADYDAGTGRLLTVDVQSGPPLWFVEDGPAGDPPEMALIAFPTHHFPAGMVISNDEFEGMPVTSEAQIGAIRWWPQNGQIHEIYVHPQRRRTGVGGALIHVAAAHQMTGGRPPVWSSGERTDLGEAFARSVGGIHRVARRSRTMPPMTPEEQQAGAPGRNLHPDPGSI